MKLTDLKKGCQGKLLAVPLKRMIELGLTPGAAIRLISIGPGGSPLEINVGGCIFLIDRKTAEQTEVEACVLS